ncbi:hypothetical protein ASZ90_017205 [hydrocarbon metagenome]|uniref:Uncharacterized protein n=1 Tax=hydrocarbon metagenome TaxID=938273 RepID=A0A0W8EA47_9ZZZZ
MNNLRKMMMVSVFVIFALMVIGLAYADEPQSTSLLEWSVHYSSSDSSGETDHIDADNHNQAKDVGETLCEMANGVLQCTVNNAYPGYQVTVDASLDNITSAPVTITGVEYSGKPDCIEINLADENGDSIVGKSIGSKGKLDIAFTQKVNDDAEQTSTYTFDIIIAASQTESGGGGNDGPYDNPGGSGGDVEVIEPIEDTPVSEPQVQPDGQPEPEPQIIPELTPLTVLGELPYTGGPALLFACAGLSLGGIALIYRRRK